MKLTNLFLLGAISIVTCSASAIGKQNLAIQLPSTPDFKTSTKMSLSEPDFGAYKVEKYLRSIPSTIAASENVVTKIGAMSVVTVDEPIETVNEQTFVRNVLTNELTKLTGKITVLLKDGASAETVAMESGLTLESYFDNTKLAVFSLGETSDILIAHEKLTASSLVKQSKVQVAKSMYQAE